MAGIILISNPCTVHLEAPNIKLGVMPEQEDTHYLTCHTSVLQTSAAP